MIWIASMKTEIVLKSVFFYSCLSLLLVNYLRCHLSLDAASGHWRKSSSEKILKPGRNAIDSFQNNIFEHSRFSEPLLGSQAVLHSQHILKILALYQKKSVGAFLNC
jgi:hypothetical protein